ncbi:hypothetical protein BHU72_11425 [Desulfuribacillus stibiiarsenatis]|uniref:Ribosomal RNA small subunit methyltransferase E n=1 Tax=Desulfuribacillus stibiiarsenatis TaxID=1390249 RepID=A0A1E5L801_9FIRM|nr:16S rRNA (uracil(1498)-N(3))-methyltransferase [Desulfuribacillus stibiiarsenatis]OEH86144.1 hypothetical protein BHU72_11425 [Desulfuribacillus stibiiarsenatis]
MQRYFIDPSQVQGQSIAIEGDDAKHIAKVLRYQIGDQVICSDNTGNNYICEISRIDAKTIHLRIISSHLPCNEPEIFVTLYQGMTKADKMEWIIQKGTEIGVSAFVPVEMKRSIAKWESDRESKKIDRWRKIAKEAAEQAHRSKIPDVQAPIRFKELLKLSTADSSTLTLLAYEKSEHNQGLLSLLKEYPEVKKIALIVGPEGGISEEELQEALQCGIQAINLGPRVLRTETAGMVAASGILFFHQELGEK